MEQGKYEVENQYTRLVKEEGNVKAKEVVNTIFTIGNQEWRGIGTIENSGLVLRETYKMYDASVKFTIQAGNEKTDELCIAGQILTGNKKPNQCPEFGKKCKPSNPLGAPMVSSEGACAAYFNYQ